MEIDCLNKCGNLTDTPESPYCEICRDQGCSDCGSPMYPWEDHNGGTEYTCVKCGYEDLPKHIMERFPQFRTKNICKHFNWIENCKACKMDNIRENTQALINKDLLLEPTIEDLQLKHKEAMHKFVIRRT